MVRAGVVVAVLAVAGCGGGDGGGVAGAGGATGPGGGSGTGEADAGGTDDDGLDLCTLLETSEVEAEFGEVGPVAGGEPDFIHCVWEVGELYREGSGTVSVTDFGPPLGVTMEEHLATFRGFADNPVDIDGLGDGAFYDEEVPDQLDGGFEAASVTFRFGDRLLQVRASFRPAPDGMEERLATLAEHVVDRL